ncbi:MAG: MBL fold metallo-hydrolase [Candidatus Peregrinibacteria bacterium]|nr:MBL fold metallo-hydrolase [Candidatus Peregrinibacteria bacterium]
MDITWHGHSCFTIKGKKATIVTDPFSDKGFALEKLKGDIVLVSVVGEDKLAPVGGEPVMFDLPGEYEVKEVAMQGIQAWSMKKGEEESKEKPKKTTVFIMNFEDLRICHLGSVSEMIPDEMIEKIGDVDILFVPAGGNDTLDAKKAHEIIEEIEPRIVIPMNFFAEGEKTSYAGIEGLLKLSGTNPERKDVFTIANKAALPQEKTEYVVLNVK